jgi:hypothetical protein
MMRRYFRKATALPPTNGNLFNTVDYAMSTNGGFSFSRPAKPSRKYVAGAALLATVAAGATLLYMKTRDHSW